MRNSGPIFARIQFVSEMIERKWILTEEGDVEHCFRVRKIKASKICILLTFYNQCCRSNDRYEARGMLALRLQWPCRIRGYGIRGKTDNQRKGK